MIEMHLIECEIDKEFTFLGWGDSRLRKMWGDRDANISRLLD
jgi:hypothetical protein